MTDVFSHHRHAAGVQRADHAAAADQHVSSTWIPLMKVYRDAFARDDLYAAAATSVVIAAVTLVAVASGSCAWSRPRAFGEDDDELTARGVRRRRARSPTRRRSLLLGGALLPAAGRAGCSIAATKTPGRAVHHLRRSRPAQRRLLGQPRATCPRTATACSGCGWPTPRSTPASARCCPRCVSALAGYALAKYRFRGRNADLQPAARRRAGAGGRAGHPAVPAAGRRSGSPTPTGRCCCRASSARTASTWPASTPPRPSRTTLLEAGRIDGAGEWRIFRSVALPLMVPGAGDGLPVPVRRRSGTTSCCRSSCSATTRSSRSPSGSTRCSTGATPAGALHPRDHRRAAVDHPADRAVPDPAAVLADRPVSGAVKA